MSLRELLDRAKERVREIHARRWRAFTRDYPAEATWIIANPQHHFAQAMRVAVCKWERLTPKQYAALRSCAYQDYGESDLDTEEE